MNEIISLALNSIGTMITIVAAAYNAFGSHKKAILLWRWSNYCLLLLFIGIAENWWVLNSGAWLQAMVYAVFCILNEYAIWRINCEDETKTKTDAPT